MAKADSVLGITGSIDEYSLYRMRGVEKTIFRRKGGPKAKEIKTGKKFVNVRRQMSEFGAAAKSGADIRKAIRPVTHVAEPFFSGKINALANKICKLDDKGAWGERVITVSKHQYLLEGLNLNNKMVFNSVIRQPLQSVFDRHKCSVILQIPALTPGLNFFVPSQYPLYRFTISLGVITDIGFANKMYHPIAEKSCFPRQTRTSWYPSRSIRAAEEIELQLTHLTKLEEGQSMILAMAIEFGYPSVGTDAERIKYAGSGIILAMD